MALPRPPYGIPPTLKVTGSKWEERRFPPGISDGVSEMWPQDPKYRRSDPRVYKIKLATDWAERDHTAQPDTMYFLSDLPAGYGCFEVDAPSNKQVYKRLFGHPSGRFFDSVVRFETHFFWLLDGKKGRCECFLCGNYKAPLSGPSKPRKKLDGLDDTLPTPKYKPAAKPSIRQDGPTQVRSQDVPPRTTLVSGVTLGSRRPARGVTAAHPVDEEGTQHVWKEALAKVYTARDSTRGIEIDIDEPNSIDWLSERESIPQYFTKLEQQHAFVPRIGELVLWIPSFPEELFLQRDSMSGQYRFYNFKEKRFIDEFPRWRGGVVTAAPSRASQNGPVDFPDLLNLPEKKTSLNTAGFRVETMPDPNSSDKSLSKQYRYVPLRNIRPLAQWQLLLKGIQQKDLHASILHALSCMTSISLVDKWRINGGWTDKDGPCIKAKGVYLGSELITIGDAVRLAPDSGSGAIQCTDVMVVDEIRLYLAGLKEEYLDLDSKKICSHSTVMLAGKTYTIRSQDKIEHSQGSQTIQLDSISQEDVKNIFRPVGTSIYGTWHLIHDVKDELEVSYDQVLGRLYEAEAVRLWSGQRQHNQTSTSAPDLGFDMSSILAGRKYATRTDERIPGPPVTDPNEIRWIISDYRAQSLDIASFNGLEVGPYFEARTPATLAAWRAHIKISKGEKISAEDLTSAMGPRARVRPQYRIPTLAELESLPRSNGGTPSGKRRGRPPGSKVIDGKLYRAGEYDDTTSNTSSIPTTMKHSMTSFSATKIQDTPSENEDYNVNDDDEHTEEDMPMGYEDYKTTTPHKHSSQMAGAAFLATDSEDIDDDDDENSDLEPDCEPDAMDTSHTLLAAYGDPNNIDDEHTDPDSEPDLSAWKQVAITSKPVSLKAPPQPISKFQVMQSVEQGHGSTLASISGQVYGDDDSDGTDDEGWGEYELEAWKDPRNARGGTEEPEDGDYMEDEDGD